MYKHLETKLRFEKRKKIPAQGHWVLPFHLAVLSIHLPTDDPNIIAVPQDTNPYDADRTKDSGVILIKISPTAKPHIRSPHADKRELKYNCHILPEICTFA